MRYFELFYKGKKMKQECKTELARLIKKVSYLRESSWLEDKGKYELTIYDAAHMVCEDKDDGNLIWLLLSIAWNDIHDWANEQEKKKVKVTKEQIDKTKTKIHFKEWATMVKGSVMAYKIPNDLIESLPPELDRYIKDVLNDLGLVCINGFWERK